MRSWHRESLGAFAVVVAVALRCFGQNSPGPATLETLVNTGEAQETPAAEAGAANAGPKRPVGTVTRPTGGVQHPDLDKAWTDYDAVVAQAADGIKAAISKQFDAATAKADLDAADKWQTALEKFEKAGEVPSGGETKSAVSAAIADYRKAKEELIKAYESVVKTLTMEKKIVEAKATRAESRHLSEAAALVTPKAEPQRKRPAGRGPTVVGLWVNDGSAWAKEFLPDSTARNINPSGQVDTVGAWVDEGHGRYSARLGDYLWKMEFSGDKLRIVVYRSGALWDDATYRRVR